MADYTGNVQTYSHSDYSGLREQWMNMVVVGATSGTAFAHFASRNKIIVRAVHIWARSAMSATAGTLAVYRGASAAKKITLTSMADAGKYFCATLTADNTADTITTVFSLKTESTEKGDWDVLYEYQVLYPGADLIGS